MKELLTLLTCNLAIFSLQAQITIDHAAYSGWTPASHSFRNVTPFQLTPSANANWDVSTQTYGTSFNVPYVPSTHASLPQASFNIPSTYSFSAFSYMSDIYFGINSQGVHRYGEVIARQAFGLGAMTMNNNDSLVFIDQVVAYSAPRTMLKFPATYGTNWTSSVDFNTNFTITVGMYGLNQTPGYRRSHITQTDSVIGWGKMRVKNLTGQVTGYMDVLAVKTKITVVDSFFLGGSPAPAALLTAFGITQGMINSSYRTAFYRSGEVETLLRLTYADSTYSTVSSAFTHADRLPSGLSVGSVELNENVAIYPNPTVDGHVNVRIAQNGAQATWSYDLVNNLGQVVSAGKLVVAGGKAAVNFSAKAPGIYFMRLYEAGSLQATKQVVIQ